MIWHRWDVSPVEAVRIQQELRDRVLIQPLGELPRSVGGLDVHGERAAVAVLSFPDLHWLGGACIEGSLSFPYLPGLLAFREAPLLLEAIARVDPQPELLLCDGQGLAHPRHFGIACHLGIWLDRPAIGCAKSWLRGQYVAPGPERGAVAYMTEGPKLTEGQKLASFHELSEAQPGIGAVVRTRTNVRPVYVSVGHRIDLAGAIEVVLACTPRYRLPEPLRLAHRMARGEPVSKRCCLARRN